VRLELDKEEVLRLKPSVRKQKKLLLYNKQNIKIITTTTQMIQLARSRPGARNTARQNVIEGLSLS